MSQSEAGCVCHDGKRYVGWACPVHGRAALPEGEKWEIRVPEVVDSLSVAAQPDETGLEGLLRKVEAVSEPLLIREEARQLARGLRAALAEIEQLRQQRDRWEECAKANLREAVKEVQRAKQLEASCQQLREQERTMFEALTKEQTLRLQLSEQLDAALRKNAAWAEISGARDLAGEEEK